MHHGRISIPASCEFDDLFGNKFCVGAVAQSKRLAGRSECLSHCLDRLAIEGVIAQKWCNWHTRINFSAPAQNRARILSQLFPKPVPFPLTWFFAPPSWSETRGGGTRPRA